MAAPPIFGPTRRDVLQWLGLSASAAGLSFPFRALAAARPDENPLAGSEIGRAHV